MTSATPSNPARAKSPKPAHVQQGVMHGTPATRHMHALALGGAKSTGTRRRSSSKKKVRSKATSGATSRKRSTSKRKRSASAAQLVKGSPAAKKRMAQLRAMVGKKKTAA